ncbi:MAG: hypothetical protein ACRCXC_06005 [Legionella sp.]
MFNQHHAFLDKWSIYLLDDVLLGLQSIAAGPPQRQYPFSLLKALISDPFWQTNSLDGVSKDRWVEQLGVILGEQQPKSLKTAKLMLALRLIASDQ